MRVRRLAIGCAALVCLTGCPSFSTLGLARPLRQGSLQVVLAPELESATIDFGEPIGVVPFLLPQAEIAVRYGVTDSFELGAKAWLFGAQLEGKLGLLQSPTMDIGVDLSFSPAFSYLEIGIGGAGVRLFSLSLPLQLGINFGGNQLVLSPKLVDNMVVVGGAGNLVSVGGSIGVAFKLSDWLRFMPEVTVIYPLAYQWGGGSGFSGFQGAVFQGGLALLFGGRYERPPEPMAP